jgi:hypothetical protein
VGQGRPEKATTAERVGGDGPQEVYLIDFVVADPLGDPKVPQHHLLPLVLVGLWQPGVAPGEGDGESQSLPSSQAVSHRQDDRGVATARELNDAGRTEESRKDGLLQGL